MRKLLLITAFLFLNSCVHVFPSENMGQRGPVSMDISNVGKVTAGSDYFAPVFNFLKGTGITVH